MKQIVMNRNSISEFHQHASDSNGRCSIFIFHCTAGHCTDDLKLIFFKICHFI